jgi:hypothetical protein
VTVEVEPRDETAKKRQRATMTAAQRDTSTAKRTSTRK